MGPKCNVTGILTRRKDLDTEIHRKEGQVMTDVEIGVMKLQAKEC